MTSARAAIAVFVKTPGLSPVKTRLAERIGRDAAERFYELSLASVEATVAMLAAKCHVDPRWAVAEEAALNDPRWQRFPRIWQGAGGLGDRLARVFGKLQERHSAVVAIGADSPQITPETIRGAIEHLTLSGDDAVHVLGRCRDGGFYLVGTNHLLAPDTWQNVPFSTSATADRLAATLGSMGSVHELARLADVDHLNDLPVLKDELISVAHPSPEQRAVLNWIVGAVEKWG
jgi:hypothetical protein